MVDERKNERPICQCGRWTILVETRMSFEGGYGTGPVPHCPKCEFPARDCPCGDVIPEGRPREGEEMTSVKTTKYMVRIGTPARNRTVVVEAKNSDAAVLAAIERLVGEGSDRGWLERYAANRHPQIGTCYVSVV